MYTLYKVEAFKLYEKVCHSWTLDDQSPTTRNHVPPSTAFLPVHNVLILLQSFGPFRAVLVFIYKT